MGRADLIGELSLAHADGDGDITAGDVYLARSPMMDRYMYASVRATRMAPTPSLSSRNASYATPRGRRLRGSRDRGTRPEPRPRARPPSEQRPRPPRTPAGWRRCHRLAAPRSPPRSTPRSGSQEPDPTCLAGTHPAPGRRRIPPRFVLGRRQGRGSGSVARTVDLAGRIDPAGRPLVRLLGRRSCATGRGDVPCRLPTPHPRTRDAPDPSGGPVRVGRR